MEVAITSELLTGFSARFDENQVAQVAMNAAVKNGISAAATDYAGARRMRYDFSLQLEAGEVTDQKRSGRCWMFAALNTMRLEVMQKLNLKTMELSQSYPLFYDKLEKANYFLESILSTLDEPLSGRLISHLLSAPVQDGGQWDMFAGLVRKYGVVPKDAMPESFSSSATAELNRYLTLKLRGFACTLREAHGAGAPLGELRGMKEEMLYTIYHMLCVALGKPPETFVYETRDKDNKFLRIGPITPQDFYREYVGWELSDYVSVINAPTADKPYGRSYTVTYLGSAVDGAPVRYLNLPVEGLKRLAIAQMQDGHAVWFGCDVGQWLNRTTGAMDLDGFALENLFSTRFPMTKAQRLDYGESLMTHAMVFTGVNLTEDGVPDRWRVENSWGAKSGEKGGYIMSDDWFSQFTYQVVVHKKYLSQEELSAYESEPIPLPPWDPMGALAWMR